MNANPLGRKHVVSHSYATDPEDASRSGEFDNLFKVPVFIGAEHHEIHEGDTFMLADEVYLVNKTDVHDFLIVPPTNGKQMHLNWHITGDDKFKILFFESPTVSANGTDSSTKIHNKNRNSVNTSSATIYDTPTIINTGTPLFCDYTDKYTPSRAEAEFVLNETKTYLLRIQALKDDASVCVNGMWYEHTPQ